MNFFKFLAKMFVGVPLALAYTAVAGAVAITGSLCAYATGYTVKSKKGVKQQKLGRGADAFASSVRESIAGFWGFVFSDVTSVISSYGESKEDSASLLDGDKEHKVRKKGRESCRCNSS